MQTAPVRPRVEKPNSDPWIDEELAETRLDKRLRKVLGLMSDGNRAATTQSRAALDNQIAAGRDAAIDLQDALLDDGGRAGASICSRKDQGAGAVLHDAGRQAGPTANAAGDRLGAAVDGKDRGAPQQEDRAASGGPVSRPA